MELYVFKKMFVGNSLPEMPLSPLEPCVPGDPGLRELTKQVLMKYPDNLCFLKKNHKWKQKQYTMEL